LRERIESAFFLQILDQTLFVIFGPRLITIGNFCQLRRRWFRLIGVRFSDHPFVVKLKRQRDRQFRHGEINQRRRDIFIQQRLFVRIQIIVFNAGLQTIVKG
jgi:hypothetical protein